MPLINVLHGNNIEVLKTYPDNSIDAIVTDAPYGLGKPPDMHKVLQSWLNQESHEVGGRGFMGKEWDRFVPQPDFWKEAYRVLKHGAHVLCFFGTRTYDIGTMAMRLAGFEIRDCIYWHYGSGFPKSMDISKAIDKAAGVEREIIGKSNNGSGVSPQKITNHNKGDTGIGILDGSGKIFNITAPATEEAKKWDGWGTALKPATEPIVLARKPIAENTVAENVIKYGTGGIHIDACRVGVPAKKWSIPKGGIFNKSIANESVLQNNNVSRFPSNLILTHHHGCKQYRYENDNKIHYTCHDDCPVKLLDEQSGITTTGAMSAEYKRGTDQSPHGIYGKFDKEHPLPEYGSDKGYASRFFYIAKASTAERHAGMSFLNTHPTVKPVKLMRYLIRMITPKGGVVLDPFCGSGTTGIAAKLEGFDAIMIDEDEHSVKIATERINHYTETPDEIEIIKKDNKEFIQPKLF